MMRFPKEEKRRKRDERIVRMYAEKWARLDAISRHRTKVTGEEKSRNDTIEFLLEEACAAYERQHGLK